MTHKLWIGLGIATIVGLMYLVYKDRPYRVAEEARSLSVPPEALQFCDTFVGMGGDLHALKSQGVGYSEGVVELRKVGVEPDSWQGILWKELFTDTWRSDLAFGHHARDMCLDDMKRLRPSR
jgi:hypothetical protein